MFNYALEDGLKSNKMLIEFIEGKMQIFTQKFKPHDGAYWLANFPDVTSRDIGSLLIDFLSVDFNSLISFRKFESKWGLSGFYDFSKYLKELETKTIYNELEINNTLNDVRIEIFDNMRNIQKYFEIASKYCLEYTEDWKDYSIYQRYFLIQNVKKIKNELNNLLPNIDEYSKNVKYVFQVKEIESPKLYDIATNFEETIKNAKFVPTEIYESSNIAGLLSIEFREMIKNQIYIKKCENCGLYFLPENRIDTLYCTRIQITKKGSTVTCQQIGATRKYTKNTKNNIIYKEYRKTYKTNYARYKIGAWDIKRWNIWKEAAKDKFEEYKLQTLENKIKEFIEWLNYSSTIDWYKTKEEE